jgi:predicted nucleic acid-binding protein
VTAADGVSRLVFDTTCLSHFARADRLDVLGDLLAGVESFVPHVVRAEIRDGSVAYPELTQVLSLEWLRVVPLDTLDRLRRFTLWVSRIGAGTRDLGEASALAIAEEFGAVALIDERDATRVGRTHGVDVHGTIWLLARACRDGKLTEVASSNLVENLAVTGMRLPCTGSDFPRYASANGLL